MSYTRRHFLRDVSLATGALFFANPLQLMAQAALATPKGRTRYLIVGSEKGVAWIDLATNKLRSVPVNFTAHSFLQHPNNPERIWVIEKWEANAAEIDLGTGTVTNRLICDKDHAFYGHGMFSPDKSTLFITRLDLKQGDGHLVGFDAKTYKQTHDYRVTVGTLHESVMLPDNTIWQACTGVKRLGTESPYGGIQIEDSSLIRVDLNNGKVLEKKTIPQSSGQLLNHLRVTKDGTILAVTAPRSIQTRPDPNGPVVPEQATIPGALFVSERGEMPLREARWPQDIVTRLKGEVLSVAVNEEKQTAIVTNPESNSVLLVSSKDGSLIQRLRQMPTPKSVSYDVAAKKFICGSISYIDDAMKTFSPFPLADDMKDPLNGPHSLIVDV